MKHKRVHPLESFLFDNIDQTKNEAISELNTHGIDSSTFLAEVNEIVQASYMNQLKVLAEAEKASSTKQADFLSDIADWGREALLRLFAQLRSGNFGDNYQQAAIARCRNKNPSELSETELRSWLVDIGETLGDPTED